MTQFQEQKEKKNNDRLLVVDIGCRFVYYQYLGLLQNSPGQTNQLFLADTQVRPCFLYHRIKTALHASHRVFQLNLEVEVIGYL
jgi:hypothetical protein